MKKVRCYTEDPFDFYKKVVAQRRGDRKRKLQTIEARVEQSYNEYMDCFTDNRLVDLQALSISSDEQEALKGLYRFRETPFSDLFLTLTTTRSNQRDMTSPNCTLADSSELDHYIPKSEFPEFSANPLNLMPCCSECNKKKSSVWREGGKVSFLNLYLDDLPQAQYLFVRASMSSGIPSFEFYLDNPDGVIDSNLFNRIQSHYKRLDLCQRFQVHADMEISDMANSYHSALSLGVESSSIWERISIEAANDFTKKGHNYWKSILKLACCNAPEIRTYIEEHGANP